ncbi:hypothetical protein [Aquimarina algiphila]|uniref:Uncharacterized protein n=1 Tax=Aquimarina algiphila TaxID=2047982 RepID=A0A554VEB6_9FLAO|nr:hypothetical protein [Aquimarina algiphila]TSE05390.1 hypothetical protein FOF46_22770 [Aquimarina algiphila]
MDEKEKEILKVKTRRRKVTHYLRKKTTSLDVKKSINIRYMERVLGFRKGRLQKFASGVGKLTDDEILSVHEHLKKLTRY